MYVYLLHSNDKIGTPLTCAAKHGHEDIVEYLLKSGADVDGKFLDDQDIKVCKLSINLNMPYIKFKLQSKSQNLNSSSKYSKLILTIVLHIVNHTFYYTMGPGAIYTLVICR